VKEQLESIPKLVPIDERMILGGGVSLVGGVTLDGGSRNETTLSNPVQRLEQAQATLAELRIKYTDSHPDVLAQKKLIAQLQAQLSATPSKTPERSGAVMVPNSVYAQFQGKLADEETNVVVQRQHVAEEAAEVGRSKQDASQAIDVQSRYDALDRDYGNIERLYQQLVGSRESASLSQKRDDQNQGVSFRVLEPPQKPRLPAAPNRLILNTMVLLMGLGGGAAIAVLLALNSGRFFTSEDIAAQFGVPLIGVITALPQPFGIRRNWLSAFALSVSVALLLLGYVGVVTVLRTSIHSVLGVLNG
jgi:hypothetical protein